MKAEIKRHLAVTTQTNWKPYALRTNHRLIRLRIQPKELSFPKSLAVTLDNGRIQFNMS
jgi:hypothetical protein